MTAGDDGDRFATAAGARVLLRLLELHQPLASAVRAGPVPALPPGVRLELWRDAAPGSLLPSYAAAKGAIADAPGSGLQVDPAWTPARVRDWEASLRAEAGRRGGPPSSPARTSSRAPS